MKITDKTQFALGVFDVVVGIALTITAIAMHRYTKIVFTLFPVGVGIMTIFRGIDAK